MRLLWRLTQTLACAPVVVTKYQKLISGPLLNRIDIHIEVPRVDYEKLSGNKTSEAIRQRMQAARNIQQARFTNPNSKTSDIISNADMRIGGFANFVSCRLALSRVEGMKAPY
jgi:magnesium chelatase family protein